MADHEVVDRNGTRWDYCTSKAAAETRRKALDKTQSKFKPFAVHLVEETEDA